MESAPLDEKAYRMKQAALWCCKAKDYDRQWKHVFCELPKDLPSVGWLQSHKEWEKPARGTRPGPHHTMVWYSPYNANMRSTVHCFWDYGFGIRVQGLGLRG